MNITKKIKNFIYYLTNTPSVVGLYFLEKNASVIPDSLYLLLRFRLRMGYWMDLNNPKTYNEKLQWLKLHDRQPEYTQMVDKAGAKEYVAERIGENYIIPTIGVWDRPEDIPWSELPDQFVAKVTHDSGGIVICKDKKELDISATIDKLSKGLKKDYYAVSREWPYKNVKRRIIVEKYMVDESGYELKDYKFFCFNGEPKMLFIATDRANPIEETKFDFFDMDFNHLPFTNGHEHAKTTPTKPKGFDRMVEIARKLSAGIPHVRVDLYDINGHIYFGEFTFFHYSGNVPFEPKEWDYKVGEWLNLPKKN